MARMPYVAVALAVWLIGAAFLGVSVSALPNHVVAGGVFGPGGDMTPGPSNPANAAGMVFYSTTQPTYPLLTGADAFTPASGTEPALFAKDVGASWNWTNGDEVVVVIETTRGVNGWAAINYTSSVDALLTPGPTVQEFGNATLEPFPVLSLTGVGDYIVSSWSRLVDTSGNVDSYSLYRTPGPPTPIATVPDAGSPTYNDTALAAGQYCYQLQVNYRRDLAGGVYGTAGRSEPACTTITGNLPTIVSTTPANGDTGVATGAPIVVRFSEPMNIGTVTWTVTPGVGTLTPRWTVSDTVLTLTHATPFSLLTSYTVEIPTGRDLTGDDLVAGPVPNPWSFTTNRLPTAVLTEPGVGVCATGGSVLTIRWTMGDPGETPVQNLRVWLNYTFSATTNPISGAQDMTGLSSPASFDWTTPSIDGTVTVLLTVMDGAGDKEVDTSADVVIDSTRPTALMTAPAPGATSVATDTQVVIVFSEAMNRAAAEAAVSFTPTVSGLTFQWTVGDTTLTVGHAVFAADTAYTLHVATSAMDACTPGLGLASEYAPTFQTGAGVKAPKPPTNLRVTSEATTGVALAWDAPTQYTDDTTLPASEIARYIVYRGATATATPTQIGTSTTTTFTDTNVQAGTQYYYWVKAVDTNDRESAFSASVPGRAGVSGGGFDWLWILIPIILVLLVIGAFLLIRRKKPAEEAPPAEAPPEEAPLEEAPPEAEPMPEEGEGGEEPPPPG